MPHPLVRVVVTAVLALGLTAFAGCSGAPTPTPSPTPTPTATVTGDGELKIGTLFPSSGGVSFIGPAQVAGVKAAVRAINAAGGVNGVPVVVVSRDSGDASTKKVEESFAAFVEQDVDVIVGPSSSVLAQRLLELAGDAGIPLISPAATYPQLTELDEDGIFFRTIATYPHQAVVFAELFADREIESAAIVFRDDDLSGSLAAALEASLRAVDIELEAVEVAGDADAEEIAAAMAAVKEAAPDAVVLATPDNGTQTKTLITQLTAAGFGGAKLWLTSQNLADYSQALKAGLLKGVNGLLEGAEAGSTFQATLKKEDPGVVLFRYAAEAYDATVLAALAAELAGDDSGTAITRELVAASIGGIKCTSFGECLDVLRTQPDVDYDGVSGSVNLDGDGDPKRGTYLVVAYNAENKYVRTEIVVG
jgi:ABC-type branched-subunit amino acid transport system substrate-binding protein